MAFERSQRLICKALPALMLILNLQCSDEHFVPLAPATATEDLVYDQTGVPMSDDCLACTYVVPADTKVIDGAILGLHPGSVIGLDARVVYGHLEFRNLVGSLADPIIIRNCGGVARVDGTGKNFGIKVEKSSHFRISGGDIKNYYGIQVTGGVMGVNMGYLSTHFEVDHVEIGNSGFAGLMAKTDPTCEEATWRGNFLMKGVSIHNNYIHDTGGEGIYAGSSFFMGAKTSCGTQLPHEIHYIRIFSNVIKNSGWEAIQLGCATKGASIHANIIENYGTANEKSQNNGIQISSGTGGFCYNNLIKKGTGNGLIMMGLGDNVVYNNVIDQAGNYGIFCDERYSPGPGFRFINNTILNPGSDGIRLYSELVPLNVVVNNIIVNPGSYNLYSYPRTPDDAFIYKLNDKVKVEAHNNYFSPDSSSFSTHLQSSASYKLATGHSSVVDQGADISSYDIRTDFYYKPRLRGSGYDIGAVEHF